MHEKLREKKEQEIPRDTDVRARSQKANKKGFECIERKKMLKFPHAIVFVSCREILEARKNVASLESLRTLENTISRKSATHRVS